MNLLGRLALFLPATKVLTDFPLHVLEMSSLPEDTATSWAHSEGCCLLPDKRSNQVFDFSLRQGFEFHVALDATGVRPDETPQVELFEDLAELLFPVFAGNEKNPNIPGPVSKPMVSRQEQPALVPGEGEEVFVLNSAKIDNIKAENFKPFGEFPEHAVNNEFYHLLVIIRIARRRSPINHNVN